MTNQTKNNNLNDLIDPTFTNVNWLFVLSFENENDRRSFSNYYVPNGQIRDLNVLIDGENLFDMPIKNCGEIYKQIIEMGRNNDYTTSNLLDYEYFTNYKLITIDSSKQIELENSDLKQQINFTERLKRDQGATMFFINEKLEETTFEFSQNAARVAWFWLRIKMAIKRLQIYWLMLIMNLQNLQQENGMWSMIKITQTMVKEMKIVQPLNLKPKSLNQVFVIIQTHVFL